MRWQSCLIVGSLPPSIELFVGLCVCVVTKRKLKMLTPGYLNLELEMTLRQYGNAMKVKCKDHRQK